MFTRIPHLLKVTLLAVVLSPPALHAQGDPNPSQDPNQDPPSRVARLAVLQGNVSLEPAGVDTFSAAELNYPLTVGDRVYADNSSLTELQTAGLTARLGNGADFTVTSLTDFAAQFGLAQGSVRLVTRDLAAPDGSQGLVEIDTPNGAIVILSPGDIRVDSYPQDDTTVITVTSGQVQITAAGQNGDYTETVGQGQAIRLAGANPVYSQYVQPLPFDPLDQFDANRERQRRQSLAAAGEYADSGMVGLSDLGQYGDWNPDPNYGQVWYPRAVPAGWTPYSVGHWAWVAPWGWTWVDAEPWGFAPFHYGRWAQFDGGRWGWVPGPPPQVLGSDPYGHARPIRAVYSPALVAFVGDPRFSLSIGIGGSSFGGSGVTAWFPLGPREAYQPWYHASPGYVNRVNVTNIYNRNTTEVRNTYINRTTNVYNTQVNNITYVNRQTATVAVSQHDFADGRRIAESQRVENDPRARQALAQAPILPHPQVTPQRGMAAPAAPPRAVPPSENRPVLATRQGLDTRGNGQPGGNYQPGRQPGPGYTGAPPFGQPRPPQQPAPGQGQVQVPTQGQGQNQRGNLPVAQPAAEGNRPGVNVGTNPNANPGANRPPQPAAAEAAQPAPRGGFPTQREHPPITQLAPAHATTIQPAQAVRPLPPAESAQPTQPNDRTARPVLSPGQAAPAQPAPGQATPRPATAAPTQPPQDRRAPLQQTAPVVLPQALPQARPQPLPQAQPAQLAPVRPVPRPPDQPRALVNRNPPQQPAQPSFAQQQSAMERAEPGRPLNPQQVQNLRANPAPIAAPGKPAPPPPTPRDNRPPPKPPQ